MTLGEYKTSEETRNEELFNKLWETFEINIGFPEENEIQGFCEAAIHALEDIENGSYLDTLNSFTDETFRFVKDLQPYLLEWTRQIDLSRVVPRKHSLLKNSSDFFLTFNYTPLIETVYGINSEQVCHIHGGIEPYCQYPPVIGRGNTSALVQHRQRERECRECYDEGGASINHALANFYEQTLKDTNKAMLLHSDFFSRIGEVDSIEIIGHSLGEVDMPYFQRIKSSVQESALWIVYYHVNKHGISNQEELEKKAESLHVSNIIF